ncbi:MAG: heavy-metal-associated domain-containing protein [Longimicrobiales bacterium]|nr:heavy-metal-associated domain-containing protein [Longimicrobiales bacterium]
MTTTHLTIEGMSCDHCVRAVRSALEGVEGASVEAVEIGSATVRHDAARLPADRLADAVSEEGYAARVEGQR